MRVTVIMPLYNHAAFVEQALRSVLAQNTDAAIDILVVDDGSTDDGASIVQRLAETDPAIRLIRTSNQGVTRTRNVGLRNLPSDCDFVTFCDSDDVLSAGRLRSDLAEFAADPDLEITFGKLLAVDRIDPDALAPEADARTAEIRIPQLGAAIFRKSLVERIGFFDETLVQSEDTDYLLRAFESGAPYLITDTVAVYYRQHGGNMSHDRDVARRYLMFALRRSFDRRRRGSTSAVPAEIFPFVGAVEPAGGDRLAAKRRRVGGE